MWVLLITLICIFSGADVNAQDLLGRTPLYISSRNGTFIILKINNAFVWLLLSIALAIDITRKLRHRLHINRVISRCIIIEGNLAVMEILFENGADLNKCDHEKRFPLHAGK